MSDDVILVTGASGFVGGRLCIALRDAGWIVHAAVRGPEKPVEGAARVFCGFELSDSPDWTAALKDAKVVVHCAGVAHGTFSDERVARQAFARINHAAAVELGRAAAECGVHRFVFMSSIGVYGGLPPGVMASESLHCNPIEPYACSKLAAERDLGAVSDEAGMELVVLRPPLVYGPKCPGNFAKLVRLVRTGLPLPFGSLDARRHFVAVENLADLVVLVSEYKGNAKGTYNVADTDEIGMNDIVCAVGAGLGRRPWLFPFPQSWLRLILRTVGKAEMVDKLAESVMVDSSAARERFGWAAVVRSRDGMASAAASYQDERRK